MFAMFGLVATSITVLLHRYLWARLVRDPQMPLPYSTIATGLLVGLAVLIPVTMVAARTLAPSVGKVLAWPAFVWMGIMFVLFMVLLAVDAVKALSMLGLKVFSREDLLADPGRRQLLATATAVASAATAGVLSGLSLIHI